MSNTARTLLMCGASAAAIAFGQQAAEAADKFTPYMPEETHNWYVSIFGGASLPDEMGVDTTYQYSGVSYPGYKNDVDLDTGFIIGAAIGTESPSLTNIRYELEFAVQKWDSSSINYVAPGFPVANYASIGDVDAFTILANVWYGIEGFDQFTPYLGGGLGVGFVKSDVEYFPLPGFADFGPAGEDTGLAFQVGAGAQWDFSEHAALDVSYRYRGITGLQFENPNVTFPPGVARHDTDLYSHNVMVGLKLKLPPL